VKHELHPEADAEFLANLRHYAEISQELGNRFYDEMSRLFSEAAAHPLRYRVVDPPLRRILAEDGFPYAILYDAKPDYVWIVAVMHLKREPGYWRERLS
jgi:plasmid stabilization system protein ParE